MLKHVVMISLKDLCFGPELENIKNNMKSEMEKLNGQIEGLVSLNVYPDCLSSSNIDVTMEMLFEDEDAFKNYKINPLKIAAEKEVLVPYQNDVIAADYMV